MYDISLYLRRRVLTVHCLKQRGPYSRKVKLSRKQGLPSLGEDARRCTFTPPSSSYRSWRCPTRRGTQSFVCRPGASGSRCRSGRVCAGGSAGKSSARESGESQARREFSNRRKLAKGARKIWQTFPSPGAHKRNLPICRSSSSSYSYTLPSSTGELRRKKRSTTLMYALVASPHPHPC